LRSQLELIVTVQTEQALYAFEPSAERVFFLDQRMRCRLAESLRYIFIQSEGLLEVPEDGWQQFLSRLEQHPVSPLAFSFYSDAVLAIEDDNIGQASRLLSELISVPSSRDGLTITELANPKDDAVAQRYARFIDTDPSIKLNIFSPSRMAADRCRGQIREAFALMDAGTPELAAEIRALLREIILGAGSDDPQALVFDGASSFMLWGAIIINANRHDGELEMVQMLAHESAHNLLFGLSADESLVENSPEELFSSPLRKDPRPMDGIYHATFVTARMHRAVQCLVDSGVLPRPLKEKALKELEINCRLFNQGIAVVQEHGKLSSLGVAVMRGASGYMAAFT
jgi:hypothetical protein